MWLGEDAESKTDQSGAPAPQAVLDQLGAAMRARLAALRGDGFTPVPVWDGDHWQWVVSDAGLRAHLEAADRERGEARRRQRVAADVVANWYGALRDTE